MNENLSIEFSRELLAYAEAAILGRSSDGFDIASSIVRIVETLGPAALVDTAATVAIFDAVVRVADATGIPLEPVKEENSREFRHTLGIDVYRTVG